MLPTLWQVSESTPAGWYSGTMTWWVILPGGWLCTRFYNTWSWNEETNFQVRTTEGFVVEKLERIYTAMAKVTNYLINIRSLLMPHFFSIRWSDSTGSRATERRFPPTYRCESCDDSSFTIVASSGWVGGGEVARERAWPHEAWRSFFGEAASVSVENLRTWLRSTFSVIVNFSEIKI